MTPEDISKHLQKIAGLKTIDGANKFSISTYQNAAQKIQTLSLDQIHNAGFGAKTSKIIKQFIETGTSSTYQELASRLPVECLTMTVVQGIGPKTAYSFWQKGIKDLDDLTRAAENGELKPKVAKAVLFTREVSVGRIPLDQAGPVASALLECIKKIPGILQAEICGSFRRQRDTVKDLDIVVAVDSGKKVSFGQPEKIAKEINTIELFGKIESRLETAGLLVDVLNDGVVKREFRVKKYETVLKSDVWIVDISYWGSALNYATGSKFHNIAMRELAQSKGMKVNEYGIWDSNGHRLGGENEHDLYRILEIDYVEPQERK